MKNYSLKEERFKNGSLTATYEWMDSLDKETLSKIHLIEKSIKENRLVNDRCDYINEKLGTGTCYEKAMGSGGVGQIKVLENGKIIIQIGYGVGKWNYAMVAEI